MNPGGYAEQQEFSRRAAELASELPAGPARTSAEANAAQLLQLIDAHADGKRVAALTTNMRAELIRAFDVVTVPRTLPQPAKAAALFAERCSSCHGSTGLGDGPAATGLDPAPTNFRAGARADQRSLYGLYSTITLGVTDTAMPSFAQLSDADRWALAFHVGGLAYADQTATTALAANAVQPTIAFDLALLTRLTPAEARASYGDKG